MAISVWHVCRGIATHFIPQTTDVPCRRARRPSLFSNAPTYRRIPSASIIASHNAIFCWERSTAEQNVAKNAAAEFSLAHKTLSSLVVKNPNDLQARAPARTAELARGTYEFKLKKNKTRAREHFQQAEAHGRKLVAGDRATEDHLILYARSKTQLGALAVMNRKAADGDKLLEKSGEILTRVTRKNPRNLKARAMLAETELFRSLASLGLKDQQGFLLHFRKAVEINMPYLELTTKNYGAMKITGSWFVRQTEILRQRGQRRLAISSLRKAIEIYERLLEFHPDDRQLRRSLPPYFTDLSYLLYQNGQQIEADNELFRSVRRMLALDRYTPQRQVGSAVVLFHVGRLQMGQAIRTETKQPTSESDVSALENSVWPFASTE